ncbi:hypothetical protein [Nocardioides convexus]|uniref:hypothetical protein n=1 Tax=Nocardioides convexus TaxID=2712224 RepID=UPI0024187032|nr:hypothetical protein [Nocardioides convexus]
MQPGAVNVIAGRAEPEPGPARGERCRAGPLVAGDRAGPARRLRDPRPAPRRRRDAPGRGRALRRVAHRRGGRGHPRDR